MPRFFYSGVLSKEKAVLEKLNSEEGVSGKQSSLISALEAKGIPTEIAWDVQEKVLQLLHKKLGSAPH